MEHFSGYLNILLSLIGGVGIFLLGMKFLSDGMQNVAGNRIKTLIGAATNNRVFGVGVGLLVTGIIQSSSVTTVLVVSLVDSGLMSLAQAVGVIMGANIGTTLTAWILTLKVEEYGLVLAGVGAIVYMFATKEKLKNIGVGVLGLGCIFLGLKFMKEAAAPIKDYPEFVAAFQTFQANTYFGVIRCAAIGCILTLVVQSSTATIGITMALASQGLIGFQTAAALVLGENIGTTITAIIASLGGNNNARRAALFHALFNTIGVFYITLLFSVFIGFVEWELKTFFGLSNMNDPVNIGFGIAAVHTTFNIFNTIVFLIPCRAIAHLLESNTLKRIFTKLKLFRKEKEHISEIEHLLAIFNSGRETSYIRFVDTEIRIKKVLGYMTSQMKTGLQNLKHCIESSEKQSPEIDQIFEMESQYDKIAEKLDGILVCFVGSEETTTAVVQQRIFTYEKIFDALESVSDYMAQVLKLRLRLLDNKIDLLDFQKADLLKLNDLISEAMDCKIPEEHEKKFAVVKDFIRSMRATLWNTSNEITTNPMVNDSYSNMLTSYRKIRDHLRGYGNAVFGIDQD
jgi:phosphate:Na+ symporter